jgi:O-antigen/teichoic acid export membrane protein
MLVRHSLVYIATNLVAGLFGFATTLILTRLITPTEYGVFGLGNTIVYFASNIFFDWQATTYLRLGQGQIDRAKVTGTFVGLFLACIVLSTIAAVPFALLAPASVTGGGLVWLALPCVWWYAWFQFSSRVHTATFHPGRVMVMNLVRGAVGLVAAVVVAKLTGDGALILVASFAGALLGSVVKMGALMHLRMPWQERSIARDALAFGLPMALAFLISSVSPVVNRVLLAEMGSLAAAGFYSVGAVLVQNTIGLMAGGVGAAAYTLAVHAHEGGDAGRANAQLANNFALLLGLLLPSAVGLALVAPSLVPRLVGAEFVEPAVHLTPWVAAATFIGCMRAHYYDTAFHLAKRTTVLTSLLACMAVLEISLGLILIPRFGYMGPAYANLAAQGMVTLLAIIFGRRVRPLPFPLGETAKILAATALMAAAVRAMPHRDDIIGLALPIGVGALVYGVTVLALDVIGLRSSALRFLGRLFRRRQPT